MVSIRAAVLAIPFLAGGTLRAAPVDGAFLEQHCYACHDDETQKGDLNLLNAGSDLAKREDFDLWALVHRRIENGEMPPEKKPRPDGQAAALFLTKLSEKLAAREREIRWTNGRAEIRRLSRSEYENTLRDVLALPHLEIAESLPPEGSAHGYDKSAGALDFSHVHASRLAEVADTALRKAIAPVPRKPESKVIRFEVKDPDKIQRGCNGFYALLKQGKAMPLVGMKIDTTVTRNRGNFQKREPGFATDEPPHFDALGVFIHGESNLGMSIKPFVVPVPGYYTIRVNGFGILNDRGNLAPSTRTETVGFYSRDRTLGYVDLPPYKPRTAEITVWLEPDDVVKPLVASAPFEKIRVGGSAEERFRFFKSHGVAFRWLELEGPHVENWPPESHQRLFGDLGIVEGTRPGKNRRDPEHRHVKDIASENAEADARTLLRQFANRALRRPVTPAEMKIPLAVTLRHLRKKDSFMESVLAGYRAILTSPGFLLMRGQPGPLSDAALAERLAYFLWNSPPDPYLRNLARQKRLSHPDTLRWQVNRMLKDERTGRFVEHFLDKWLRLEDIALTEPDSNLYPDYNPLLLDAMLGETRAYFSEMLAHDLGARFVVDSDFAMLNQRLADLYGIEGVAGNRIRRVELPEDSIRGGLLAQASILKTSANGTVTSPVVRGDYVLTHFLGDPPPPPPPTVPAVEPDISGATTIREQLSRHREVASCATCHRKIDPPGFAMECFDVMGGFRTRYRSLEKGRPLDLFVDGKQAPTRAALPVDASGELPTGETFRNFREFRELLLEREDVIGRNLLRQLIVYATGAPIGFADRDIFEDLASKAKARNYGLRTMIHLVVQSPLFLEK